MGTTRAALHLGCRNTAAAPDLVTAAFATIGWARVDAGSSPETLRVAVLADPGGAFATVVVDGADAMDDGTLKDLAVALTRDGAAPTLVTGVQDSDDYEAMLFADGRQIDALGVDPTPGTGLAQLAPRTRAQTWATVFGRDLGPVPPARDPAFADSALVAVLTWVGIDPHPALQSYAELSAQPGVHRLAFQPTDPAALTASTDAEPHLAVYHDDDDCPHHRVYPAHWPLPPDAPSGLKWLVLSQGAGFDGARLDLHIDELSGGGIRATWVSLQVYPFFNGQIVSPRPVASHDAALDVALSDGVLPLEFDAVAVPDVSSEGAKRLILVLRLEVAVAAGARAHLRPVFHARGADGRDLPPVRLVGGHTDWQPRGCAAVAADAYRDRLLLELNARAVLSTVAILDGDTPDLRAGARAAAEAWLAALAPPGGCNVDVLTKRHMTASGAVTKKRLTTALPDLLSDRGWPRWFSAKADLHTLQVGLRPAGAFQPHAGVLMTTALHTEAVSGDLVRNPDAALHVAFWSVDHPQAWTALGIARDDWRDRMAAWVDQAPVLQAFQAAAAWIPEFDAYEQFAETPYEALSGVDWFRRGLQGTLMTRRWCGQTLRTMAPRMWLSESLMDKLPQGPATLAPRADVARTGAAYRVSLHPDATLSALESLLAPILPSDHA